MIMAFGIIMLFYILIATGYFKLAALFGVTCLWVALK